MEHVESLLSAITFILKTLDHGQVDNMDIELLKSFSFSHLVIAESLKVSSNDVEDDNIKDKSDLNIDQENSSEYIELDDEISKSIAVPNFTKNVADIESIHFDDSPDEKALKNETTDILNVWN